MCSDKGGLGYAADFEGLTGYIESSVDPERGRGLVALREQIECCRFSPAVSGIGR